MNTLLQNMTLFMEHKKEMDICVSCGKETKYPKMLNIDLREHYIEGAGQLCPKCFLTIYKELGVT